MPLTLALALILVSSWPPLSMPNNSRQFPPFFKIHHCIIPSVPFFAWTFSRTWQSICWVLYIHKLVFFPPATSEVYVFWCSAFCRRGHCGLVEWGLPSCSRLWNPAVSPLRRMGWIDGVIEGGSVHPTPLFIVPRSASTSASTQN